MADSIAHSSLVITDKLSNFMIKAKGGGVGGSKGKKCPILIFQYVIELKKKRTRCKKREVDLTSPSRDIVPQRLGFTCNCIGSLSFKPSYLWIVFSTSAPVQEELA